MTSTEAATKFLSTMDLLHSLEISIEDLNAETIAAVFDAAEVVALLVIKEGK